MAQLSPPPQAELAALPPAYSARPRRTASLQPAFENQHPSDEKLRSQTAHISQLIRSPMTGSTVSMISPSESYGSEVSPAIVQRKPAPVPRWPFEEETHSSTSHKSEMPEIIATAPMVDKPLPIPQVVRRRPVNDHSQNNSISSHRRTSSDNPQTSYQGLQVNHRPDRAVSMTFMEEDNSEDTYQPLQYHHQPYEDTSLKALNQRASKLTIGTTGSEGSSNGEFAQRPDHLGPYAMRNSHIGNSLQRPDSGFSSTSDMRGRTDSPQLNPLSTIRNISRSSRSPDTRPLSHVDLLNVPYPQAPPSGAEGLVNSSLRTVVGNNASLLSTRKTLDMYRANVKKTSDPGIQYEFAVFMISAAQEENLENDAPSEEPSQKSSSSIRNDLLKEAKVILQKLCDRSYPFAQYYLADGYASGLFSNGRPDLDRSFPLFLAASKHGHAEAMYRTALCYEYGWGCRVDAAKAVQFYQHAASKNHPGAMLRLGRACLTGDMGLGKRYREGIRWLKRGSESADFQYNQAPYDLACLHETGFGADVFKDEVYAAQLYTKAADLGQKDACFRLGEAYEYGQLNCPKDPALSIHFYTGAAEQNHPQSQMALCAWYMVGVENVLDKDETEAYEWAKRAAHLGLAKAQYTLGYFTEMGIGCRRDPLEANVWYVRAADQNDDRAKQRIAAIRAAATGADPIKAAKKKSQAEDTSDGEKKKRFGIF